MLKQKQNLRKFILVHENPWVSERDNNLANKKGSNVSKFTPLTDILNMSKFLTFIDIFYKDDN